MKINLSYPVTARAEDDQGRKVHAFGVLTGSFEIPDAADESHPMAIEFRSGKVETPQRYRFDIETGQVLRYMGSVTSALKTGSLAPVYDGEPSLDDLYRAQDKQYEFLRKAGQPVIPELEPERRLVPSRYKFAEGLAKVNKDDTRRCHEETRIHLSHYRVINGAIWQPCREPTLKVSRGNDAWGVNIGNHDFYSRDWHTYYFSVDEFDAACEWIDTLDAEVKQRTRTQPAIVVHPQFKAVTRGGLEDIRHLARHVAEKVARAGDNLADQRPGVIMAFSDLKRFLETPPADIDDDEVDAIVATVDGLCRADENGEIAYAEPDLLRPKSAPLRQLRGAVDLHIRRWQDRPIYIVTKRPSPTPWGSDAQQGSIS
ncbi:hypothetical protein OIU34_23840 [Pararhizobium sp. BT-229]|uniref:hypothetical protein n=1 Tax=Pararhizobium sp. BT-229 TaxID=2986923 RepID=UPI0021F6EAAF|nr:hypothetical protein [Pararhizobium sp. BT-229]MCV9964930.1 hypothetical protein [Pararhizobium sp. BT-229]